MPTVIVNCCHPTMIDMEESRNAIIATHNGFIKRDTIPADIITPPREIKRNTNFSNSSLDGERINS
jgi:hypothetical protein